MKKMASSLVAVALSILLAPRASGQTETKLLASDGAAGDKFGWSVSISGDTAIVGADGDDDNGGQSGSAYIFEKVGDAWVQQAKLLASDGAAGDDFGISVSINGGTAIVGAPQIDTGSGSGTAYLFELVGGFWTQTARVVASDGAAGDYFGGSVSVDSDTAIVGASVHENSQGDASGAAYIFEKVGGVWTQTARLFASDGESWDYFGRSVFISGDTAIVGAPSDDDRATRSGAAYIFAKVDGVWAQRTKLHASDGAAYDEFGKSVSMSGEIAIVGSYGDDSYRGSAYIFEKVGAAWMQQAKLLAPDGVAGDWFGMAVAVGGDVAIVGASHDDDSGSNSGSAFLFEKTSGVWALRTKLVGSDGASGDWFGGSVSVSEDAVIIGASQIETESGAGAAYVFAEVSGDPECPPDLNADGLLDFFDVQAFLNYFAAHDPAADFIADGMLDFFDVQEYLSQFAAGCPD